MCRAAKDKVSQKNCKLKSTLSRKFFRGSSLNELQTVNTQRELSSDQVHISRSKGSKFEL